MRQYKTVNTLMGWFTFLIAAVVYCMTVEPTASFWDCPEFITTAYKLEVGHPPGAPFFMLVANLFTQLTSDAALVAKMVNYMSALMSAACILFLFWSITHLTRKLIVKSGEAMTLAQMITILGSGFVGALAYTFSDTFWFSAVEGEVYAFSSLFTALVFWLILKWEDTADDAHSDRWLILIAYLTGLSIGVHLLNLLCLPAIVLVYYYKKNPEANLKGSLLALLGSGILVAVVLYGIVPGVVKVGGTLELLFVNTFGMPFNTGVFVYIALLATVIIWGIYESYTEKSRKRMNLSFLTTVTLLGIPFYGHGAGAVIVGIVILALLSLYLFSGSGNNKYKVSARTLNTAMLCIMTIMIGYSSYALIVIRSVANPPMDQNSPEDIFTLGDYLGREQYGTRPLFHGQTFASRVALEGKNCEPQEISSSVRYVRKEKTSPHEKDSYTTLPGRVEYKYAQNMLFPRMYSASHADQYKAWINFKGREVPYDQCGETIMVTVPTQWENIKFFFSYQLNFMYWRYFMWNFVGRQNDIQGSGEIENGNWVTGFKWFDETVLGLGNQDLLPKELKENKGHNVFYALPLLLGLAGLFWQANRGRKGIQQFWVVFFLFFMTGIAIVLYLNQTPTQPRERDYAYAGSFYAFAIWIGMGVAALVNWLQSKVKRQEVAVAAAVSLACVLIPVQMGSQTWDDHDRSNRYVCRDFGQNYLNTLQEKGNPIIFTNGDNDTFPLWYNQDVEGVRTDARTCNLSYLQTDWYIDQMKRPAYDSPSLPITFSRLEYMEGANEYVLVRPELMKQVNQLYAAGNANTPAEVQTGYDVRKEFGDNPYELKNILDKWVRSDKEGLRVIPTDSIVIKIDKEAVRRSGMMIPEALGDSIPDYMHISLKGKRAIYKSELMMLEMLANANWERPIYMAITVGGENRLGMDNHFIQEGLAYRFTPFDTKQLKVSVDSEKMYDNLMNKFKFGNIDKEGIYIDENTMRMCYTHRRIFSQLITQLLAEHKDEKALAALDYCEKMIPDYNVPYDYQNGANILAEAYYILDKTEAGDKIMQVLAGKAIEYINWYLSMSDMQLALSNREIQLHFAFLDEFLRIMEEHKSPLYDDFSKQFSGLYDMYVARIKSIQPK